MVGHITLSVLIAVHFKTTDNYYIYAIQINRQLRDRGEGGAGGSFSPLTSSQMKISMLLLRRSVNKSYKDTKAADESDAQIAGNGIKEVLNFKISRRQPSLKTVDGLHILSSTLASPLQITLRGPCN